MASASIPSGLRCGRLRTAGERPEQVPGTDTVHPDFAEACRQSRAVAEADEADAGLSIILDSALADLFNDIL